MLTTCAAASRSRSTAARTGRDVVIAALLGADEFGFATAPLIAAGCIMMPEVPSQHLPGRRGDAGPGAAQAFPGTPEHVINYFFFVAEEFAEIMAGSASARSTR